ncbi:hypothetical protein B9K03_11860, partial [Rothia sp. Olga]
MNKHWAKYTEGLLNIHEVNTIERELLDYFQWNIVIKSDDLIKSLRPLLDNYKIAMMMDFEKTNLLYFNAPMSTSPHKKHTMPNNKNNYNT